MTDQERTRERLLAESGHDSIDQTARKRAEAALRESEERYRRLTESTTDIIYIADRDGNILYANSSAAAALRCDMHSIVGKRQNELFSPEMAKEHTANIAKVFETGEVFDEDGVYHFGSEEVWLNTRLMPLRDEKERITAVMGVSRNITDRKRAAEALQKAHDELERRVEERTADLTTANEELRTIYNGMIDGLLVADMETKRCVRTNAAMCRLLGYSREELLSLTIGDIHPPETVASVLEKLRTQQEGQKLLTEDRPILRKDGTVLFADISNARISYHGRPCIIGLFRDITERKRVEEELRKDHHTLRHLLQSSDHERQLIAYEIHDGLAQQLAGAIMQFQTFHHLKETKPNEAAKAYEAGMTMLQQGHFEARRLIAGVRPPILDESGVLAAVGHLVNEHNRMKGPEIEYRSRVVFDRLAPTVENAIYRIVQESLANACRHSKSEKVRVSLVQRDDRVQIEIRDWGIGFDTKAVPPDRFGLVGIRQRIRLLGGKCSIRSTMGKGTRIAVELPVVDRE
jgi:PAS domain S-box-containing protein